MVSVVRLCVAFYCYADCHYAAGCYAAFNLLSVTFLLLC
jgi:hypothetical protein